MSFHYKKRREVVVATPPDPLKQFTKLVIDLTKTDEDSLDEIKLKEFKMLCKKSDLILRHSYSLLFGQLKSKRVQIRYLSLQLIDILFTRSHQFRQLLVADLPVMLELTIGINGKPLPPPTNAAAKLKSLGVALIKQWQEKYGASCKQLSLATDFLKNNSKIELTDVGIVSYATIMRKQREEQARKESLGEALLNKIEMEIQEKTRAFSETLKAMNVCFEILVPKPVEEIVIDSKPLATPPRESRPLKTFKEMAAAHGLGSSSYELTISFPTRNPMQIVETSENAIIFENLREFSKALGKYISMVNRWLNDLTSLAPKDEKKRDVLIKRVLDIQKVFDSAKFRCEELNVQLRDFSTNMQEKADDDTEFEEVIIPQVDEKEIIPMNALSSYETSPAKSVSPPQKPEILPCRARLKNGLLCPRRDLFRCPFHGIIIPRDDMGLPLVTSTVSWEIIDDGDNDLDDISVSLNLTESAEDTSIHQKRKRENEPDEECDLAL